MQVCQVTWWEGQQRCPAAREGAEPFSHTCPECRGQSRILSNPPPVTKSRWYFKDLEQKQKSNH